MKYFVGLLAVAVLGIGMFVFTRPVPVPPLGAVPVLTSPVEIDGTSQSFSGISFRSGTSTVCLKKVTATSTFSVIVRAVTVPFPTTFQIAIGATPGATTTNLGAITAGSSGQSGVGVSSTTDGFAGTVAFPNQWVMVQAATSTGTTVNANFAPTGDCQFFQKGV